MTPPPKTPARRQRAPVPTRATVGAEPAPSPAGPLYRQARIAREGCRAKPTGRGRSAGLTWAVTPDP
eukprot:6182016-Prymnesium_polylepis.1